MSLNIYPPEPSMLPLETSPSKYYLPFIFLWDPWSFARKECGASPNCPECGKVLERKGFTTKRILRLDMQNGVAVTRRFKCEGCSSCKTGKESKTFAGWDPKIRAGLPTRLQHAFEYRYEHRALVDTKLIEELSYLSLNNLPVATYARMLKERAVGVYHRKECAWKEGLAAAKTANPPQSPFHQGPVKLIDFGEFGDKKGYNWWVPEAGFWRRFFGRGGGVIFGGGAQPRLSYHSRREDVQ
jgi:hypothetical protein